MATIRLAGPDDYETVLNLVKKFADECPIRDFPFSDRKFQSIWNAYLVGQGKEIIFLLLEDEGPQGLIVGHINELPISEVRIAAEIAWYVRKEYRGRKESLKLLEAFEAWADYHGVPVRQITDFPEWNDLQPLYERKGYNVIERNYIKVV